MALATPSSTASTALSTSLAALSSPRESVPVSAAPALDPEPFRASAPAAKLSEAVASPPNPVTVATGSKQVAAPAAATAIAGLPVKPLAHASPGAEAGKNDLLTLDIRSQLTTRIDGKAAGKVDFQQSATGLAVRLGSIVELLADRYEANQIARIRSSAAGEVYLPLLQLREQGIPISYDPVYDEFNVGLVDTRPKAARKVHMDQISTPERGLGSTGIDQVRR